MMEKIYGLINEEEKALAEYCLEALKKHGADQARVSLNKSVDDSITLRDGETDKVTHSADRAIFVYVFTNGRFGTFSTNMLDKKDLDSFTERAVKTAALLDEDKFRTLCEKSRKATDALTGRELGLFDEEYGRREADNRYAMAEGESIFGKLPEGKKYRVISEECDWSETLDDNYLIDSEGLACRHTETNYGICSEITIEDKRGRKISGYSWDSAPFLKDLSLGTCSRDALERAVRQIAPRRHKGGKLTAVVESRVASRLVSPILSALSAQSIQQKVSFLCDSLNEVRFHEGMTIMDSARTPGRMGSRLYDTEGVATKEMPIIENGRVMTYFVNTYMSKLLNIAPTVEGVSRPVFMPMGVGGAGRDAAALLKNCGSGIYITGFNGGNCNATTGDFSYGVEGFAFRDGEILHPVREMLITGNMLSLWRGLVGAGDDARSCTRWQIPSLAFENVDFSG